MLVLILIIVGLVVLGILLLASRQPDTFRVERATVVQAAPETIFPLVNNLHNWEQWSPFEALDPNMRKTYSGPEAGEGATFEWEGNNKAGAGRIEIIESRHPSLVRTDLRFLKPFKSHNNSEFILADAPGGTQVTWAVFGDHTFASKVMCIFISMDKMMGKDFERGLASMKNVAEQPVAGGI